ncbi:PREDICTED: nucleoside diphosphate kinase 7 [Dinoponera quadriceps]|uniref:Nucleoside diphosphate kinase 7 n=1 Tax=Dinoponera quadriceps TaxID=609295 RepID=A0A6P3XBF4_DINQU|nr:PREDICTED: nucleoside diphosphate kinase 7 [Dinoponera quadriceps]XP_014475602.1 PREDICTED: nucleoside diphosphate kinase 7 [Dinoponera quadriceps]XP_014475603.1 PREDICTED: nucleoside diphosphate kinase 7 [Dinoponera quadriceps]XP_014475604.1 PREDICTED: nucleoside diphosphate kinase 7 [Dinoponera quadriceps]XP_014475606.1 PREDICTED: nucleoside diphosphate kinase 7 [Dinoponera quadriceps]
MSADYKDRYVFEAEWYDKVASLLKKFYLYYFPSDNTVELFDLRTRKTFLKRTRCEGIKADDIHVGAIVTIFSRNMKITGYADTYTKNKLQTNMEKVFVLLKPDVIDKMGEILKMIIDHNFQIVNMKMMKLTPDEVTEYYPMKDTVDKICIINYLTSGPVVALELLGKHGIASWQELAGPDDSKQACSTAKPSLKVCYGKDEIHNAVYGSENVERATRELQYFFPDPKSKTKGPKNTATLQNCTCCIIKPHAVQAKLAGAIIDDIQKAGYTITAVQQFYVNHINAEEFLEIYKGVLPEYNAMVTELHSGPCIAMEVSRKDEGQNVIADFRNLCGPRDPDIARQIRPGTLRAKYGKTKAQNAVHCSDLPEDGVLEVEYFFKILDGI